jgi:hypothetical protein
LAVIDRLLVSYHRPPGCPRNNILNLIPCSVTHLQAADRQEARMNHWHDTMVDRPEPDGPAYLTGWTISGLAVIATIVVVWVLGI